MTGSERTKLPRMAERMLKSLFPAGSGGFVICDFEDAYLSVLGEKGKNGADRWLAGEIIKIIRGRIYNAIYWSLPMFRNYLKLTARNMMKQKAYSFINIFGLSLGIACCLSIFLYVQDQLSYDRYHADRERVFRVCEEIVNQTSTRSYVPIAAPAGPVLAEKYPQVEYSARLMSSRSSRLVKYGDRNFFEENLFFADKDIFNILTIPFVAGDPRTALERPGTVVIAKNIADKYFAGENPIGKTLEIDGREMEVTGVVRKSPTNTHLQYNIFASMATMAAGEQTKSWLENWYGTMAETYVKLKPGTDVAAFGKAIETLADDYIGDQLKAWNEKRIFFLQPVADIHLHSNLVYETQPPGNIAGIYILSGIGILVLVIACINFINLSTARSAWRAREVGLRKAIGGRRGDLIVQFLNESLVISLIAVGIAIVLFWALMPLFNTLAGSSFSISDLARPAVLIGLAGIVLFCGIGAGIYPALYLSSFSPAAVLKGTVSRGRSGIRIRSGLVIVQSAISIILIIGTLVIGRQIDFMKKQYPGFDKDQKLCVQVRGKASIGENLETIRAAFIAHPAVSGFTASSSVPGHGLSNFSIKIVGGDDDHNQGMFHLYVEPGFIEEYGIPMMAGRTFREDMPTDMKTDEDGAPYLLNESAARALGFEPPESAIGAVLRTGAGGTTGTVIGVTGDFHFRGLQAAVDPLVIQWNPGRFSKITLAVDTGDIDGTLAGLEGIWKGFFPDSPFESFFLDDDFNRQYMSEERLGSITGVFTMLGIVIAALGMLGLASFTVEQKTKEIGIRKVLGASTLSIDLMLMKDFSRWVLVANLIAWPVAWFAMDRWLDNFAVRSQLSFWTFALAGLLMLAAALVTVNFQSIRASSADPVKCLRYE